MIVADARLITKGDEEETKGGQECILPAQADAVDEEKAEAV